jgi:prepilin-type processing-associated H-X9-DG protein
MPSSGRIISINRRSHQGIGSWQSTGGFSREFLTHGNRSWTYVAPLNGTAGGLGFNNWAGNERMQECHYMYRNVPLMANNDNGRDRNIKLAFIKPLTTSSVGCPAFRTQKLLGGRSIAADSFSRYTNTADDPNLNKQFSWGYALFAHKEGYNVLYGDGHTAWYGDPQQRMAWSIYWQCGTDTITNEYTYYPERNAAESVGTSTGNVFHGGGCQVGFHFFDTLAGIDTSTPYYPWQ